MALTPLSRRDPAEVGGYRLQGRLGSGGMGVVYLAAAPDGRSVAVKVMRPELGDDAEFLARFRQEISAARRVSAQFTAQVLDANADASPPWLVTAYVEGPSLSEAVASHGPLPPDSVLAMMAGVGAALAAIHAAGLVHRDMKPSNVLLAADGPRVIDFGIARAKDATSVTRTGKVAGSPHYMAPEQARGELVGASADVWALGALGFFAATGRPPFGEGTEAALLYRLLHETPNVSGCPPQVAGIIGACLNRDPAARPSPGQVMEWCQPGRSGRTLEYTRDWLPPALAADLAGRAGPAGAPAPAGAAAPVHGAAAAGIQGATPPRPAQFPPAVPRMPAPASPSPGMPRTGMPTYGMPGTGLPGTWMPGAGAPPPGGPVPGATAPAPFGGGGGWQTPPPRRRSSRGAMVAIVAGAVVLAVLIGVAVYLYSGAHRSDIGYTPPTTAPTHSHGTSTRGTSTSNKGTNRTTPAVDPCVVGTWIVTLQQVTNTINGEPIQFIGDNGWTVTIQANGQGSETWTNSELTAEVDGNDWREVVNGAATYNIKTEGSQIIFSNQSVTGTYKLFENGSFNNTGQLSLDQESATYSCSGNSFRESTSNDQSAFVKAS